MGNVVAHRAVLVNTAIPYPDHVSRPTICYIPFANVAIENAPAPPVVPGGDVKHTVEMRVDGIVKHSEEV
jgi:hypothetical protein